MHYWMPIEVHKTAMMQGGKTFLSLFSHVNSERCRTLLEEI